MRGGEPIALIADFASRLVVRNDALSGSRASSLHPRLVLSQQSRPRPHGSPPRPFFNTVIWIVDKEGDLPDWLLIDNPRIRHVPVAKPDPRARRTLAGSLLRGLDGFKDASPQAAEEAIDAFVDQTEGLLLVDMTAIAQLGRTENLDSRRSGMQYAATKLVSRKTRGLALTARRFEEPPASCRLA